MCVSAEAEGPLTPDAGRMKEVSRLIRGPVFVCGAPRSGTTLMRDLLDGHRELCVLPAEGSFLTLFAPKLAGLPRPERLSYFGRAWVERFANPLNRPPFWLLGRSSEQGSPYVRLARMLSGWHATLVRERAVPHPFPPHLALVLAFADTFVREGNATRPTRWVDKTPTNERHLDRLLRAFPEARIVHMVRHPYSVFASYREMEERAFGSFRDVGRGLRQMRSTYHVAARARAAGAPAHRVIRYEDLVDAPERVMSEVAELIGVDMEGSLLEPTVLGEPSHHNSSFRHGGPAGAIHSRTGVDAASHLSSAERRRVGAFTATAAAALGYRLEPLTPLRRLAVRTRELARETGRRIARSARVTG